MNQFGANVAPGFKRSFRFESATGRSEVLLKGNPVKRSRRGKDDLPSQG